MIRAGGVRLICPGGAKHARSVLQVIQLAGNSRPCSLAESRVCEGLGVFGLPFDSGHILALRVFPENDFSPYRTIWHRDPDGRWAIYVDGPRLDTACPRYYGAACEYTGYAHIDLTWTGPATLRVTMDIPSLEWTLTASSTRLLDMLNAVSNALPRASWRPRSFVRAREALARERTNGVATTHAEGHCSPR